MCHARNESLDKRRNDSCLGFVPETSLRENPSFETEVIKMANLIGRTPSSVAMRLSNYAALDPMLQARGVVGLQGGSEKCRSYWEQFSEDKEGLIFECERILAQYEHTSIERKYRSVLQDIPENLVGKTREQIVQVRVNQSVFRQIVLANYDFKCALSGIDIPELLVASHVIPWSDNEEERMNPKNCICLSSLYDKAFDQGLISFLTLSMRHPFLFSQSLVSIR